MAVGSENRMSIKETPSEFLTTTAEPPERVYIHVYRLVDAAVYYTVDASTNNVHGSFLQ